MLRYVGVIWLVFHILQNYAVRFTQQNSHCISESMMKHMQKPVWNSDFPLFSYSYQKCMFVDLLTGYISPPNCVHYQVLECPLYMPIRDKFPSLFEIAVLRSLKSFFQLDHRINIVLYLTVTTVLRHFRELTSSKPS